jgi:hypothetical protein
MLSSRSRKRLLKLALRLAPTMYAQRAGSYNKFAKISESWAVKFCYDKEQAATNYLRQRRAARHGLAPQCFGLFQVYSSCYGEYIYGYITEVVETDFLSDKHRIILDDYSCGYDTQTDHPLHWMRHLVKKLTDVIGFEFSDNHSENVGRNSKGQMVCIDFDY